MLTLVISGKKSKLMDGVPEYFVRIVDFNCLVSDNDKQDALLNGLGKRSVAVGCIAEEDTVERRKEVADVGYYEKV